MILFPSYIFSARAALYNLIVFSYILVVCTFFCTNKDINNIRILFPVCLSVCFTFFAINDCANLWLYTLVLEAFSIFWWLDVYLSLLRSKFTYPVLKHILFWHFLAKMPNILITIWEIVIWAVLSAYIGKPYMGFHFMPCPWNLDDPERSKLEITCILGVCTFKKSLLKSTDIRIKNSRRHRLPLRGTIKVIPYTFC